MLSFGLVAWTNFTPTGPNATHANSRYPLSGGPKKHERPEVSGNNETVEAKRFAVLSMSEISLLYLAKESVPNSFTIRSGLTASVRLARLSIETSSLPFLQFASGFCLISWSSSPWSDALNLVSYSFESQLEKYAFRSLHANTLTRFLVKPCRLERVRASDDEVGMS